MASFSDPLPIDGVLGDLAASLAARSCAVLVAPPGAGKTTRVPLALLDEAWARDAKLILLEPRRLAARAAAERMAATLREPVGETIGLRVRLQSMVSARTRIEVVTEGVFTRMIGDDPALDGIAAVLFDEFHERSLDADLGLALALDAQTALRPDLRLLVMSATLDGARVAALLGDACVVESRGRAFPVETRYVGRDPNARIEEAVGRIVVQALAREPGSVLVFLPGQREILRTAELLAPRIGGDVDIALLFGSLDRDEQDRAVRPAAPGRRKIVLATAIAETSLTIEGVRIVVDSGLARVPRYEPGVALTRLETVRVSRAAADQRRGRAGRTQPGVCYRLWEPGATAALDPFDKPEILSADLTGLILDLADWGVRDPASLAWLDPPPAAAVAQARAVLQTLGAVDLAGAITPAGRELRALALPPRLARMVLAAASRGQAQAQLAADLAAVIVERGIGGDTADLAERVETFRRDRSPRARNARQLAEGWARQATRGKGAGGESWAPPPVQRRADPDGAGRLLALAYPERIAKRRGRPGEFLMANGRAAALAPHDTLAQAPYLAIAEVAGRAAGARILAAAALSTDDLECIAGAAVEAADEIVFDPATASLKARRTRRLGALVLAEQPLTVPATQEAADLLAAGIATLGVGRLPWSKAQRQWRDRVAFLRRVEGDGPENPWPDLGDGALAASAAEWLSPFVVGKASLADISGEVLEEALRGLLPWPLDRRLEEEAPTHYVAPTGSRLALDYAEAGEGAHAPVLAVRVQELFGLSQHPAIAGGRVPLTLHLLSPAQRPIQITGDLPGFWKGSWAAVKTEMKGRYPRHPWPDDPAGAAATTRAKPRGT